MRKTIIASVLVLCTAACGPGSVGGDDNGGGDRDGGNGGGDGGGGGGDGGIIPGSDANCGQQEIPLERTEAPPDLLIVLDKSGSMNEPINPINPFSRSKWSVMVNALKTLTTATEATIRYGMSLFPTDDDCGVDSGTVVSIDINHASEIAAALSPFVTGPGGGTPAHLGLQEALATYQSQPPQVGGRYVLFATDGAPNCGGDDGEAPTGPETVAAVRALAAAGIKTYVLGFGTVSTEEARVLNEAAEAGGVPRATTEPYFFSADTEEELQTVLEQIAGGIVVPSCSFALNSPPPNPNDVTVLVDGMAVPRNASHTNGWDYAPDANTITLFGSYCDRLLNGQIMNVQFIYGCPGPVDPG